LFRLLVESVRDYAIFMLDPTGHVATWNVGAQRIKGWQAREIVGQHFSRFYPEPEIRNGKPERMLDQATARGSYEDEGWRVRKDGSLFWASCVLTAVHDEDGTLVGFAKVTRDLTERRRSEEARRHLEVARQAVRARDDFLAIASHELRTPLTALSLQAQALQRWASDEGVPPAQRDRVAALDAQVHRVRRLVDNLLTVSAITSGALQLRPEPLDLGELAQQVVARWALRAERQGSPIVLTVDGPADGRWDAARLDELLSSLVENAVKYSAGEPVAVKVSADAHVARVEVRDRGIGISAEDQARIFERFERAVPVSHFGGFGVGLWAARQIAIAHGGDIAVESEPGQGSRFVVWLPRRRAGT
jgi:PAS domain S-box-containing protein